MEPLVPSQNGPATSELFVRVAAIDQGTNTTRLLVADVEDGRVGEILRRSTITRLGEGVDARRRLLPLPITRVRNCLSDYRRELESLGAERALLVATSAVRDAENGEAFLGEIEWSYGFTTRLLTGEEEAELTLRGVGAVDEGTVVVDIGGGSMELISSGSRVSTDLGSVRLTERFLGSDPPTSSELEALGDAIRSVLEEHDLSAERGIGVAGTVTSLAALDLGLVEYDSERVHGHRLGEGAVKAQLDRLAALPLAKRRAVPGLEPERAPVIVAGAAILLETMRHLRLPEIEVSERDILDGAALEAASAARAGGGRRASGRLHLLLAASQPLAPLKRYRRLCINGGHELSGRALRVRAGAGMTQPPTDHHVLRRSCLPASVRTGGPADLIEACAFRWTQSCRGTARTFERGG